MRLDEFENSDPLRVKLTGITSQLRARMRDTDAKKPFSVDAFLNMLSSSGIYIERDELFDMIKQEPLSNIISNIQGNNVIFKGMPSSDSDSEQPDDSTETLEKMAKRAEKRRD